MSRIMTTCYLTAARGELRPRLIERLSAVAAHARDHEPDTLRCAILTPDEDDGVSVYVVDEYATPEAREKHSQSQPVKDLAAFLLDQTDPVLASAPILREDPVTLSSGETCSFTRPTVNDYPNAYIVLATFHYRPGLTTAALPGWKKLVAHAEAEEPRTLTYTVLENTTAHELRTVEAYESKQYARDVHLRAPGVQENQEQNGHLRVPGMPTTIHRGHQVAGYLGRPSKR